MRKYVTNGFTLAELLIALAILGVIATFTIPKLVGAQKNSQADSVLKEAYATVNTLVYQGRLLGKYTKDDINDYVLGNVNAIKICDDEVGTQGCRMAGTLPEPWMDNLPGALMHSGALLMVETGSMDDWITIVIDANNDGQPNTIGKDQMVLATSTQGGFGVHSKPGKVFCAPGNADNEALCKSVGVNDAP